MTTYIPPSETFVDIESATDFKGFEALHSTVIDVRDPLLCSDVQTEARPIYNKMRQSFEMF